MARSPRTYLQHGTGGPNFYLLVRLIVAAALNSQVSARGKVRIRGYDQTTLEPSDSSNTVPATPSTPVTPQTSLDANSSAVGTIYVQIGALSEYFQGIRSLLEEEDLENSLDYYNEKTLIKEYDFEPTELWERLASSAKAHGTTPSQFLQEMQDLISLQNRSRSEQDDTTSRDEIPKLPSGYLSENLLKRMTEGWKNELKRIEEKYNISAECNGPDSITATRLALMFPHYINFGQKPFANPTNITLGTNVRVEVCNYGCRYEYLDSNVPSILGRAEFGGLIPLRLLGEPNGKVIVGTHLYALHRNDLDDVVPFRTKCVMLKRHIEKSMLSDDRRLRFLINNDIIHRNGTLLRKSITQAFDQIPQYFKDKIDWEYLEDARSTWN